MRRVRDDDTQFYAKDNQQTAYECEQCECFVPKYIEFRERVCDWECTVNSEHCTDIYCCRLFFLGPFFIFDVSLLINPFAFNTLHLYTSIWKRQIAITIQYARQCLDKMKQFLCWELWLPQLKTVCVDVYLSVSWHLWC